MHQIHLSILEIKNFNLEESLLHKNTRAVGKHPAMNASYFSCNMAGYFLDSPRMVLNTNKEAKRKRELKAGTEGEGGNHALNS